MILDQWDRRHGDQYGMRGMRPEIGAMRAEIVAMRAELDTLNAEKETERSKRELERSEREDEGDLKPLQHLGADLIGTTSEIVGYCNRFVRKMITGA